MRLPWLQGICIQQQTQINPIITCWIVPQFAQGSSTPLEWFLPPPPPLKKVLKTSIYSSKNRHLLFIRVNNPILRIKGSELGLNRIPWKEKIDWHSPSPPPPSPNIKWKSWICRLYFSCWWVFFFTVYLSVGASFLMWTSRVPSPPPAAASSPCMFSPHQYAPHLLNVRASRTVRDGNKGEAEPVFATGRRCQPIFFTSDFVLSELLTFPRLSLLSHFWGAINGFTLDLKSVHLGCWLQGGGSSLLLLRLCFIISFFLKKKERGDVCAAQGSSISRLFRTGDRFDCVLRKKVSDLFFFYWWEVKVIARSDWCGESRWCFLFLSSAVILASMNRATCLLWRKRWINYLKDTTSDWGRTLEVCAAFIHQAPH